MQDKEPDEDIKKLLWDSSVLERDRQRTPRAINHARRLVGQRDTLVFALIRIWSSLAKLLAPFFAALAKSQAEAKLHVGEKHRSDST